MRVTQSSDHFINRCALAVHHCGPPSTWACGSSGRWARHDTPLFADMALHHSEISATHLSFANCSLSETNPSGVLATTNSPEVPLSSDARCPGVRGQRDPHRQETGSRIARQQARDQRTVVLARAGVHDLTRALVDHHEVVVVKCHVDLDRGIRVDDARRARRQTRNQVLSVSRAMTASRRPCR